MKFRNKSLLSYMYNVNLILSCVQYTIVPYVQKPLIQLLT